MIEKVLAFCKGVLEGAAVGATSACIVHQYDKYVSYLPKPVRYAADALVSAGTLYVGLKLTDKLLDHD